MFLKSLVANGVEACLELDGNSKKRGAKQALTLQNKSIAPDTLPVSIQQSQSPKNIKNPDGIASQGQQPQKGEQQQHGKIGMHSNIEDVFSDAKKSPTTSIKKQHQQLKEVQNLTLNMNNKLVIMDLPLDINDLLAWSAEQQHHNIPHNIIPIIWKW